MKSSTLLGRVVAELLTANLRISDHILAAMVDGAWHPGSFKAYLLGVPDYRSGGPGFNSRALQEKKVVCLERGPLSLVSTTEPLLARNSSGSGLERREYSRRDSSR
jgi:hypothetical protein